MSGLKAKWYVIHTYSGYEKKVKINLQKTIKNCHLEKQILEVKIFDRDIVEIKNGKNKNVKKNIFPGYVLVHMVMNEDTWYIVRNIRGVTGFVGPESKPVPLTDQEMLPLGIIDDGEHIYVDFQVGDIIRVISGAWKDIVGKIDYIDMQKRIVIITVELFGRGTPIEIGFTEIVKLSKVQEP